MTRVLPEGIWPRSFLHIFPPSDCLIFKVLPCARGSASFPLPAIVRSLWCWASSGMPLSALGFLAWRPAWPYVNFPVVEEYRHRPPGRTPPVTQGRFIHASKPSVCLRFLARSFESRRRVFIIYQFFSPFAFMGCWAGWFVPCLDILVELPMSFAWRFGRGL